MENANASYPPRWPESHFDALSQEILSAWESLFLQLTTDLPSSALRLRFSRSEEMLRDLPVPLILYLDG